MNLIPLNDETRALAESLVWFESSEVAPPRPIQPASWPIPSFDWWLIDEGGGEIVGASLPVDIFNDIDKLEIIDPEMEDSDE